MFPSFKITQLQQPPTPQLGVTINRTNQQKKLKRRQKWNSKYILLDASIPQQISETKNKKIKKAFKIQIAYLDGENKRRSKTIFFGNRDDYINHHDNQKRAKLLSRLNNKQDPFHPNYYRAMLTNRRGTVKQAYVQFIKQLQQMRQKIIKN